MVSNGHIDMDQIKHAAAGQWREILSTVASINPDVLDRRHHPCPKCGGKDRFRAFTDFDETGGVICNQCFNTRNGDGIAVVQWALSCDFQTAIQRIAKYLGVLASGNRKPQNNGKPKTSPVDDLKSMRDLSEISPEWQEKFKCWVKSKPPITVDAIIAAGGLCDLGPPNWHNQWECIGFPAYRTKRSREKKCGVILYRVDGEDFPENCYQARRKAHTVKGSKDGWIIPGSWEAVEAASVVVKVEGVTDALALYPHLPPGHAVITNICGCKSVKLPMPFLKGKQLIVVGNSDEPGQAGARKFVEHATAELGCAFIAKLPFDVGPDHGKDIRDFIAEGGDVKELLADPIFVEGKSAKSRGRKSGRKKHSRDSSGASENQDEPLPSDDSAGRIEIEITPNEKAANDLAVFGLTRDPTVFSRGGSLVRIVRENGRQDQITRPDGVPRIAEIKLPTVRELLAATCYFWIWKKIEGEWEQLHTHPPDWCVKAVHTRGEWLGIRSLDGIITAPVLRSDGTLFTEPGYDSDSWLFFEPAGDIPEISERPTREDAIRASEVLFDVVQDFPFTKDYHRSAWLASTLTPVARYAFTGPAPLFLIDSNVRGAGNASCRESSLPSDSSHAGREGIQDKACSACPCALTW
jgi:hypothetical protein